MSRMPSDPPDSGRSLLARLRGLFTWRQRRVQVAPVDSEADASRRRFPDAVREALDVVIGLDFGTSSTKAVVRTPYRFGGRAEAIDFRELAHASCKYLLPTRLHCHDGGAFSLEPGDTRRSWHDLKVKLLDAASPAEKPREDDLEIVGLAAGYLGLVIRFIRDRFWERHRQGLVVPDVRWRLNIGIPSAGYDDEATRRLFLAAAEAGWVLSGSSVPPTLGVALGVAQEALAGRLELAGLVSVIPEVAAEVVGYARSPRRSSGLHLLVDVGASTLDVCGFVLHEDGQGDRYELLTASVKRLGALELHRRRLGCLVKHQAGSMPFEFPPEDPVAPIPDLVEVVAVGQPELLARLQAINNDFRRWCTNATMEVVMTLKKRRDPNSPRWKDGLPVFVCGGASGLALLQESLDEADGRLGPVGTRLRRYPPPALAALANEDVDEALVRRLGVAYGLSFDSFDIGTITAPGEIEDIPRPGPIDWRSGFIDKDQV